MSERPTVEWILAQIADEEKAGKEYEKYGFYNIARDEHKHKQLLEKVLAHERGRI
jgi:hypothetical protein